MDFTPHYYGNTVRKIFLLCGLVMLITLPFLKSNLPATIFYTLLLILALAFFAGMTNPRHKAIIICDCLVSVIGFVLFAYQATTKFSGFFTLFFATNLVLGILFLFAFYWSVKTLRETKFPKRPSLLAAPKTKIIKASEDTPAVTHHEMTEEEVRKQRFLRDEE